MQSENGILDKLDHFLEGNLNNLTLTSDILCKAMGVSRSQLFRIVKEKTQLSITLYVRQKRLDKARNLLSETDMRISEIAYLVGIESPQNFSKYFSGTFKITPTEFRNQSAMEKNTKRRLRKCLLPFYLF